MGRVRSEVSAVRSAVHVLPHSVNAMPLHPALKHLIETKLRHTHAPQWAMPIAEVRRAFRDLWTPTITGEPIPIRHIEDIQIPSAGHSIPARVYAEGALNPRPLMLYFHGGGYVKGGIQETDAFCRNLALATRHLVLSVGYRLAPEHRFPAALDDALSATIWAAKHAADLGAAPGPVVVSGESAGGNLAAVACTRLRSNPDVAIRYQVLVQPVVDFTMSFPSITMASTECLVPREDLAWYYRTYSGEQCDPRDPSVSPIFAQDLSALPPALVIAAEYDTLRDEAKAYAERLRTAGIATRYICVEGMVHGFLQMPGLVPAEAQAATQEIAQALG